MQFMKESFMLRACGARESLDERRQALPGLAAPGRRVD